jgi:glycosyltransferase involved in cell wall biosynthesis
MLKHSINYFLIRRSGLFDKQFYLDNNPDVRAAGIDPLMHFMKHGWKEGRNPSPNFDTSYYLSRNEDVRQAGINPLIHYLRYGVFEKRACLPPNRYTPYPSDEIRNYVQVSTVVQPPLEFLLSDGHRHESATKEHDTAVILHVFYPQIFKEIATYLSNLDNDFDLYVSLPISKADFSNEIFAAFPHARIILTENRGRDIAPFLQILGKTQSLGYTHLLKLHTKQSPHRMDGEFWRKEVYEQLVGAWETVALIKNLLKSDREVGIIGPKGHVLNNRLYLGGNQANISWLAGKAGIQAWQEVLSYFVAGTMFWAKPEAFRIITSLDLQPSDFEPEPIDADCAMVHGVERFMGLAAAKAGFKIVEVDVSGQFSEPSPDFIYQYTPVPQYSLLGSNKAIRSIVFFSAYQEEYAIEYLRIIAPFQRAGIEIIDGGHAQNAIPDKVFSGDAVIFQREFPQNAAAYEQIVKLARQANKPIIYDIDDLLFALPEGHPEKNMGAYTSSLLPMLLAVVEADLVTVTTTQLQQYLRNFNPHVNVFPNYLDDNLWGLRTPKSCVNNGEPLKIGYMGSSSHTPDLEFITPVLIELINRFPGKIQIRIWGTEPPQALRACPEVQWIPSPSNTYKDFVRYFQTQYADIFVAPLLDNIFNQCKSPIKFFEYSALGTAGVYSRVAPYEEVIQNGINGFLASTQEEWLQYLIQLVEDEELRLKLAVNAQNTLRSNWLLSKNIVKWYEILDSLPKLADAQKKAERQSMTYIIRSIAQQQQQAQVNQLHEMIQLKNQTNSLISELHARGGELIGGSRRSSAWFTLLVRRFSISMDRIKASQGLFKRRITHSTTDWRKKFRRRFDEIRFSRLVQQSEFFNPGWYLENYPDVVAAKINPIRHYILHGGFEGRDPSPNFSSTGYLNMYPDVLQSGMNPLIHYLRFGRLEARSPQISSSQQADAEGTPPEVSAEKVLQSSELIQLFSKKMKFKRYVISTSHNSYLKFTGGVQLYAAHEQKSFSSKQTSYLHLFPNTFLEYLPEGNDEFIVGMNLDGEYLGISNISTVLNALNSMDGVTLADIHIHHLMGFQLDAIQQILEFGSHRAEFWLHDFFSICPSYHLLRNDIEYCSAPDINSNACSICKYVELRKQQLPALQHLFEENELRVFAPSNFVLDLWKEKFPYKNITSEVAPLITLNWTKPIPVDKSKRRLRIGFLGYPMEHKGWNTWMNLIEACAADDRYQFFHFSWAEGTPGNYQRIQVAVTPENPNMMLDKLNQENIDVAILWSIVPETFSFTLHEALAAGCIVITNKKSGNIQDFLRRFPQYGIVLDSEKELIDFFAGDELVVRVKRYQENGKPQGELVRE